ncbi:hypothetical protein HWV62_20876 [Athelia sp. TMB]|nr:hypothetical protein HWV62_20876 [Athelia sp. TMB]
MSDITMTHPTLISTLSGTGASPGAEQAATAPDDVPALRDGEDHGDQASPSQEAEDASMESAGKDDQPQPGEDPQSQPGTDAQSQPGEDGQSQPGEDGQSQSGEDDQSQPDEDTQSQSGEDVQSQSGEDTQSQSSEDDRSQSSDLSYQDETGSEGNDEDGVSEYTPSEGQSMQVEDVAIKDEANEPSEPDSPPPAKRQRVAPSSSAPDRKQKGPGRRAPTQGQPYTICNATKGCNTPLTAEEIDDKLSRCKKHRLQGARGSHRFRVKKKEQELAAKAAKLAEAAKVAAEAA